MEVRLRGRDLRWVQDNLDGYLNFYSVAGDGRVTNWTIVKVSKACPL